MNPKHSERVSLTPTARHLEVKRGVEVVDVSLGDVDAIVRRVAVKNDVMARIRHLLDAPLAMPPARSTVGSSKETLGKEAGAEGYRVSKTRFRPRKVRPAGSRWKTISQ